MKLHTNTVEEHSAGLEGVRAFNFQIAMNSKAFAVTIDKLYADKVKAFVREYSANAWDAQPDKSVPIEVHMPSIYEPWWSVTDNGPGLADDKMENIFCVLFRSTKDDSNADIGGLGLGCKSGFAYTDQFTVESRHNGEARMYTATRADGMPKMIPLTTRKMDPGEKTGLTIQVPVRTHEIDAVVRAAKQVYAYFDVKPKFTHKAIQIESRGKPVIEGKFWRYYGPKQNWDSVYPDGAIALMGQIPYPIDRNAIHGHLTESERALLNVPLEIDVKMGEVDIQPSREGLSYDKATIDALKVRLSLIAKDIANNYLEPFRKTYKTDWEKALNYDKSWINLAGGLQQTVAAEMKKLVPNGNQLTLDLPKIIGDTGGIMKVSYGTFIRRREQERWAKAKDYDGKSHWTTYRIPVSEKTRILIVDALPRYKDKIDEFYSDSEVIAILPDPKIAFDPALWGDIPMSLVEYTSKLTLPPTRVAAIKAKAKTRKLLGFNTGGGVEKAEIPGEFEDGGYFFKRENSELVWVDMSGGTTSKCMDSEVRTIIKYGIIDRDTTFAVNKAYWHKLTEDNGWQCGFEAAKEALTGPKADILKNAVQQIQDDLDKKELHNDYGYVYRFLGRLPKGVGSKIVREAIDLMNGGGMVPEKDRVADPQSVVTLAERLGIPVPKPTSKLPEFKKIFATLEAQYPMLIVLVQHIHYSTLDDFAAGKSKAGKAVLDYIK